MVFFFSADLPLELMQLPFVNLLINLYLSNLYNFLKRLVFARKFVSKPDQLGLALENKPTFCDALRLFHEIWRREMSAFFSG